MKRQLSCLLGILTILGSAGIARAEMVVDFEGLPTPASRFYNGNNRAGNDAYRGNYRVTGQQDLGFGIQYQQLWSVEGFEFNNNYTQGNFDSWSGWSWSNVADSTTAGFGNQYAASPGGGSNGAGGFDDNGTYAMSFGNGAYFNVNPGLTLSSMDVTNGTYGYLSMLNGDQFAKQFGGASGNDPDLFQVTFTAFDATGGAAGSGSALGSVTVDLADYRFADNSQDYILNTWRTVDLSSLAGAHSVGLTYSSTDVGTFGINTPLYVAVDNLNFVPEPSSLSACLALSLGLLRFRRRRS